MKNTLQRRLPTTGRLSSRMSAADKAKLQDRLAPYAWKKSDATDHAQIEVEIGMGNGLALFERAKQNPEVLCVGVEIYLNGLRSLAIQLEKNPNVTNVRIVGEDARDFLETLPKRALDRVLIPYPDPWTKGKHHKRRLVQESLLDAVASALKEEGMLWLITDIPDYALWMIRAVYNYGVWAPLAISPQAWATAPAWWVTTKYEQKAFKEGRKPWYMAFKKTLSEGK